MSYRFSLVVVATGLMARVAAAESLWPEFRGPTGQGHSTATGLPLEWGPKKNIVWRSELPGRAWSSPVAASGKIFVTNARLLNEKEPGQGVSLRVLMLNATSGRVVWNVETFRQTAPDALQMHDKNSHASPTALFENGRIYAHFGHHGTACVDETG
ncbi:MAG: PQQ-binding-like beta-propeller repeat protein, partial [Verrucomicrobia bacterium]|nr:PQQ-binding-like beta-propeller repeat protein [Verrucomicrobiota bacterium]